MNILQLKYFCAVADTGHVTRTAEGLHISQPSLTQGIKRLEKELGVPLFRHQGRNVVLTDYGKFLYDKASQALDILDKIPVELSELSGKLSNSIKLKVSAASTVVVEALIKYREHNSHINFHISQNENDREYDISIFTLPFYKGNSDDTTRIFSETIYLAVPKSEEFKKVNEIDLYDMKSRKFISLAGSSRLRQICDRFCMNAGFLPNIIFESDSPDAVRKMIAANLGVGFWPHYTWGSAGSENIKLLHIKSPICQRDIVVQCKASQESPNYPEVEKFFEFLVSYFDQITGHNV